MRGVTIKAFTVNILNVTITLVIVYFCTNLNVKDADHFFIFYFSSILLIFAGSMLRYCGEVIARFRDEELNTLPLVIIPMILLSRFFVNDSNIIFFVRPLKYITIFKWAYQVYTQNEYNGLILDCSPKCNPVSEFGFEGDITDIAMWSIGMFCVYHIFAYALFVIVAKLNK